MIKTSHLHLAVFLTARGFPLLHTESNGGPRISFIIDAPEAEARAFYGPNDSVSAKRLFEQWRALRNLIDVGRER
jgi:hypothetical protein